MVDYEHEYEHERAVAGSYPPPSQGGAGGGSGLNFLEHTAFHRYREESSLPRHCDESSTKQSQLPVRLAAGLTTIELLIVLAIVGIVAAISIPFVSLFITTPGRAVDNGARSLYMLLSAAKTYATTYSIETAIAYDFSTPIDSSTGAACPALDIAIMVRRLRTEDLARDPRLQSVLAENNISNIQSPPIFVPVRIADGQFRPLEDGTVLLSPECWGQFQFQVGGWDTFFERRGMRAIRIIDRDLISSGEPFITPRWSAGFEPPPPPQIATRLVIGNVPGFPAHVFMPGGEIKRFAGTRERVTIRVGLPPNAPVEDRIITQTDAAGNAFGGERYAEIELFPAQGRVRIGS